MNSLVEHAPRSSSTPATPRWPETLLLLLVGVALYLLPAGYFVKRGLANADEGVYALVAREVMQGRLPYRDFAYPQMPLLPYMQGAAMSFTGFGVHEQRWVNAGWGALALALAILLWRRGRVSLLICVALVIAWCACKQLVYHHTIGKTYSLAQLWLLAAGACLFLRTSPAIKLLLFSLAAVLAVGCRLTVVPALGILWIGLAMQLRSRLSWWYLVGVPVLTALILLGPFFASDPVNAWFWNLEYHLQTTYARRRWTTLLESFAVVPAVTFLAALGTFLCTRIRFVDSPWAWLFAAGLGGWILGILSAGIYTDYALAFVPLLLTGFGGLASTFTVSPRARGFGVGVLGAFVMFGIFQKDDLNQPGYLPAIEATVAYVREHSKEDDVVLSSMPEIPLEAGRKHFPGLELGKFGVTAEMPAKYADQLHIVPYEQLVQTIEAQAVPIVVLCESPSWSFAWSIPSQRQINQRAYQNFTATLERRYTLVYRNEYFRVFIDRRRSPRAP